MKKFIILFLSLLVVHQATHAAFAYDTADIKSAKLVFPGGIGALSLAAFVEVNFRTPSEVPAQLVLEGVDQVYRFDVVVSVKKVGGGGINLGLSAFGIDELVLSNIHNKTVDDLLGDYEGTRSEISLFAGRGNFMLENEEGATIQAHYGVGGAKLAFMSYFKLTVRAKDTKAIKDANFFIQKY